MPSGTSCSRPTRSPSIANERATRIDADQRQHRSRAGSGNSRAPSRQRRAERIVARRDQRHRREGDEHDAGPEILRRADVHVMALDPRTHDADFMIARSARTIVILRLDVSVADHLLPLVVFGLQERRAVLRTRAVRLDADLREGRDQLRLLSAPCCSSPLSFAQHVGGHARRREDAEPEIDLEALQPGFVHRRQIRIDRRCASVPVVAIGAHAVVLGERQRAGDAGERELNLVRHHVGIRLRRCCDRARGSPRCPCAA